MSSAILQGVPATTLDTDLWIDVPERQYLRLVKLSLSLGATLIRPTVVALRDGSLVNFLYRVDGLSSFPTEWRRAVKTRLKGVTVKAIPLERIIRSKEFIARPKDLAVLPLLKGVLASRTLLK